MIQRIWKIVKQNLGTKIVSVLIALILWIVVLGSRNVEVTKEVPLDIVTSVDTVPANDIPDRVAFRLSGPKAFLRAILDRREEPIRINLTGSKPGLVTYRLFADNIRLPIGVKVLSVNPSAILVKLEYLKRREVPLRVETRGSPPEGYKITRVQLKRETVRIKGAESRVDSISEISTLPIDVSGVTQSFERDTPIDLAKYNVQLDGDTPSVFFEVASTHAASANFRIRNVDVHVLSSHKFTLSTKTVTVLVRAAPQDLKNLTGKVNAVIDLRGKAKGTYKESVHVTLPSSIGLVKVIPDKLEVVLQD